MIIKSLNGSIPTASSSRTVLSVNQVLNLSDHPVELLWLVGFLSRTEDQALKMPQPLFGADLFSTGGVGESFNPDKPAGDFMTGQILPAVGFQFVVTG